MKKLNNIILNITFLSIIFLPLLVLVTTPLNDEFSSQEKRKKAEFSLSSEPGAMRSSFEEFFNDNFGFRDNLIRLHGLISWHIFRQANTGRVIIGKNGWLFLGGGATVSYIRHQQQFTESELENWKNILVAKRDWLRKRGIKYLFLVAPNKHSIFPENLPNHVTYMNSESCFDQLVQYLKANSDLVIVDLREDLLASKGVYRNYHKTDHHWNDNGAFVAYEKSMQQLFPDNSNGKIKSRDYFDEQEIIIDGQDLALMMGLQDEISEKDLILDPRQRCARPREVALESAKWPAYVPGHEAYGRFCEEESLRLVLFQDSFGRALAPFFSESFRTSTYIWDYPDYEVLKLAVEQFQPDVVVEQRVERHLKSMPPRWRSDSDLSGAWNFGEFAVTISSISLTQFLLVNEGGATAMAFERGGELHAPQWDITGHLSDDRKNITWSNGTVWYR